MDKTTVCSSNWKMRVFHLCHIMTHPLRKIVHMFYRFHPQLFYLIYSLKFSISITNDFLIVSCYLFQKGQIVIKCELVLCFCKLCADSEEIRHCYCVTTVSFTNMTFSVWIEWLRHCWAKFTFDFECKISTDYFLKYTLSGIVIAIGL